MGEPLEIELAGLEEGVLVADSIQIDEDPSSYPIELKGYVADLAGEHFRIVGVPVRLAAEHEVYGELETADGEPIVLAEGLPVKVKGEVGEDGVLVARRLKFYAPDAEFDPELRGALEAAHVEGERCRLVVAGVPLVLAADADVDAPGGGRPRLERADLVRLIESWGPGTTPEGFEVTRELYDLVRDAAERTPLDDPEAIARLESVLERLAPSLLERMVWSEEDRAALSEEDLEALRAIGYTH